MGREPPKQDQEGHCRQHRAARELSTAPLLALKLMPCLGSALPPRSESSGSGFSGQLAGGAGRRGSPLAALCERKHSPGQRALPPAPPGPPHGEQRQDAPPAAAAPLLPLPRALPRGEAGPLPSVRLSVPPAPVRLLCLAGEAGMRPAGGSPKGGAGGGF